MPREAADFSIRLSHLPTPLPLPCSPLPLPVVEPPLGRARLSLLAALPRALTLGWHPLASGVGGRAVFTLLQPLVTPSPPFSPPKVPMGQEAAVGSLFSVSLFSSTCPFSPSFSSSPKPVSSPPPALDAQPAPGPLLCFCPTSPGSEYISGFPPLTGGMASSPSRCVQACECASTKPGEKQGYSAGLGETLLQGHSHPLLARHQLPCPH